MHFFQKKSKTFPVFFVMRTETEELSLVNGGNLGSSLPKNNSRVAYCFYVFYVLVLV